MTNEYISLKRDVQGIAIPSGQDVTLFAGTEVRITQALGGAFTVVTHMSQLASIAGKDADALGKEIPVEVREEEAAGIPSTKENIEKQVWKKLKTCFDPEIPHNIVDLGLVYGCDISELSPDAYKVAVTMTLTAAGCGMGEVLKKDAQEKLASIQGVKEARVDIVFDPPWTPAKMNPVLRREFL